MIILKLKWRPPPPPPCTKPHPQGSGPESSPYRATTKWASGDQNEPESSEAAIIEAHHGDGNEPQSSDTMTRGTTADQNVIMSSPLQSRLAVLNVSTPTQNVFSEGQLVQQHAMCSAFRPKYLHLGEGIQFSDSWIHKHPLQQSQMSLSPNFAHSARHIRQQEGCGTSCVIQPGGTDFRVDTVIIPPFEKKLSASDMYPFAALYVPTAFAESAGKTTDLGNADTESEEIDIELEACVQQDAPEANALELLFRSKKGMSSILGVGVEFAKVLVVPASLEVKIIGIGHTSWDALWQDSSNNKDDVIDIVSIAGVRRPGAKLENPSNVEYLTAKQSATKYGVGLKNKSNTAHVNSTDVEPQSDCSCILDKVVEYLLLKKVIGAVMDKQCDGDEGQGSSSGGNGTKQDIGGSSSSQIPVSLLLSFLSLHGRQKPIGGSDDDDDDDETSPSRVRPHQVNQKRPTGNFCRVTVLPGHGGFQHQDLRAGLNSVLKYRFFRLHPPIQVLEDLEERQKYLGMGMCEAVVPTCIGTWLITPEDVDELSPYRFDAERTLNRIFKVGQGRDQREHFVQRTLNHIFKVGQGSEQREQMEHFVQRYCVPMFVNHAMSHLCTLKDIPKLKERETLLNVLQVGIVGI
ncbi:unnamed protein product [Sphagnum troendelagicum]|uniref:Uncharacterized protein n=1 Tax=Sphagnum troendelagicum TaxID=128251 RepID=A0ABP0UBX9_9BRYO